MTEQFSLLPLANLSSPTEEAASSEATAIPSGDGWEVAKAGHAPVNLLQDNLEFLQAELLLLQKLTLAINKTQGFSSALSVVLELIVSTTHWEYGEVWLPNLELQRLECSSVWYGNHPSLQEFHQYAQTFHFNQGEGLPGRVWITQQIEWIRDIALETEAIFRRKTVALQMGLNSVVGIPLIINHDVLMADRYSSEISACPLPQYACSVKQDPDEVVLAVLVFFMQKARPQDPQLLELVATLTSQMASLVQGKRVEEALRLAEEKYRGFFENAIEGIFQSTFEGYYLSANPALARIYGYESPAELMQTMRDIGKQLYVNPLRRQEFIRLMHEQGYLSDFESQVYRKDGEVIWILEKARAIRNERGDLLYYEGTVEDITERKLAQESLQESKRQLHRQNQALMVLARHEAVNQGDLTAAIRDILEVSAETLDVERASVWFFDESQTKMTCFDLFERTFNHHSSQQEIMAAEYPIYFCSLEQHRTIDACDAQNDPRTHQLTETYLKPLGILSMLDAPILCQGKVAGVVCFEDVTFRRQWSIEEQNFAGSIADLVALALVAAERRRSDEALRQAEEKYRGIFENAVEGIFQTTPDGRYLTVNPMLAKIYGYESPEDLMNSLTNIQEQLYVDPKRRAAFQQLINEQGAVWGFESQVYRKDGSIIWISENARAVRNHQGQLVGYEGTAEDITRRKQAEETIQYQAFHDLLTGLPNRTFFDQYLHNCLDRMEAFPGQGSRHIAVMFLDLDRFKIINDTLGHPIGDQLLQSVAQRLSSCLREGDIVARWGGDEFILLLPNLQYPEDALHIAQRVLDVLRPGFHVEGHELYATTSIGIALYPQHGRDVQTLVKHADAAVYQAKEQGRNNYQVYVPAFSSQASELLALENQLHGALERDELVVFYQPQLNIQNWQVCGIEALVRWQHPELGLISPWRFISMIEENGLILPIGAWIMRVACTQNRLWQQSHLSNFPVSVNLSARQFQQTQLVESVQQILRETELAPQGLQIEITESTAMHSVEFTCQQLQELRAMGVQIAIDDFGAGYSSLSYIKRFPLNTLKIDRSFIQELSDVLNENAMRDQAIIAAILALGRGLNLNVIAEGVETREQLRILRSVNCQRIQGFLYSPPLTAQEATRFLESPFQQFSLEQLH